MKVQDVMTNDCGCIPVVDNRGGGRPIGTITDRDIAVRAVATGRDVQTATVRTA